MNAKASGTAAGLSNRAREVVVEFSPEAVRAPFLLRCGAMLIDYIVVVAIPVITLLVGKFSGTDASKPLTGDINNIGWMIAVLLGLTDLILLPMISGQTIGKMLTGIRIVAIDGTTAPAKSIALRQLAGYFFTLLTLGLGFFLSVFSRKGRALHDYLSDTVVIYADKKIRG